MKFPRLPSGRPGLLYTALALVGFFLSCIWLTQGSEFHRSVRMGTTLTALWWLGQRPQGRARRGLVGRAAWTVTTAYQLGTVYIALSFGWLLGWTTPLWLRGLVAVLVVVASSPQRWRFAHRLRVPVILPIGLWIAACLLGWQREDGAIRCDDQLRALSQPGVSLLVSSASDPAACRPGDVVRVDRYPRRLWESGDRRRWIVTTQPGINKFLPTGRPIKGKFTGSVCAIDAAAPGHVECVGTGKAQAILENSATGTVFVALWGLPTPGYSGALYEVPVEGPWRILREKRTKGNLGEGYLDPSLDVSGFAVDEGNEVVLIRPSTLEDLPSVPYRLIPTDTHYDGERHEGIFCAQGETLSEFWGLAIAFRGWPFVARPIGHSYKAPWSFLSMPEGCDWNPQSRRVYTAVANLGLLSTIDYDTGEYLRTSFVGWGVRTVKRDPQRHRLYIANFLRGDVLAIDEETGRTLGRWFAGRFVRFLTLSRDGTALLAASNLGVLRLPLD